MTQKLYCYVDETGQDTLGKLFIVVAIVVEKEMDSIIVKLEKIERQTKKGKIKWFKTKLSIKNKYLVSVLEIKELQSKIYYQTFAESKLYQELTNIVIAKAVNRYIIKRDIGDYQATVLIDGLRKTQARKTSKDLRDLGIKIRKVRGVRDESNALIRLADAMAGSVRKTDDKNRLKRLLNDLG